MANASDLFLLFLRQFAGGPGPIENNLVRFGLAAVLWGALAGIAWNRQRTQKVPREKLLVWGFGLGLAREAYMFAQVIRRLLDPARYADQSPAAHPFEHALSMASVVVVAGAFLRYILDDERISRRYLQIGIATTGVCALLASWQWSRHSAAFPEASFHNTWPAWAMHVTLSALLAAAIALLTRKKGWLRNIVLLALVFFFLGEFLVLASHAAGKFDSRITCPIGNAYHIAAIGLLGYVYLREQSIEKRQAEQALEAYRNHLEDLVQERTTELAHLHQASIALASALDADEIYAQIARQSVELLNCQAAWVLLWDQERGQIRLASSHGLDEPERETVRDQASVAALLHTLATQRQTIAIADAAADPQVSPSWTATLGAKALLCLPIMSTQEPLGYLFLMDVQAPRQWRTEAIELVESFVNPAAVALANAKLHKQLEWAAALEERQRIAANMHDGLGQTLSLLGLRVDQVADLVADGADSQSAQELQDIRELIEQASHDVRRSIASLQETPRPRRSLQEQLIELAEQLPADQPSSIQSTIEIQEPLFLPPEHQEQVLPIVQEALLNAQYHAQARRVQLLLERQVDQVQITVQDDGKGFDPDAAQTGNEGHFGLSIMRARAARIGAQLQVDSRFGRGTRVTLAWTQNGCHAAVPATMHPAPAPEVET